MHKYTSYTDRRRNPERYSITGVKALVVLAVAYGLAIMVIAL